MIKLLIIRTYPKIDGSLTLQMRLAKKMLQFGMEVTFLITCPIDSELKATISNIAPVILIEDFENGPIHNITHIYAGADGEAIYLAYIFRDKYYPNAPIVFWALATNSFVQTSRVGFSPDGLFYKFFLKKLPEQNLIFPGNGGILRLHRIFHKKDFINCAHIPNGIEIPLEILPKNMGKIKKIVSISRIEKSKEYIFGAVTALKELIEGGYDYELHFYGDGHYMEELRSHIDDLGLTKSCFLHGLLPYGEVNNVLKTAHFFIGMGGAIIEAASQGVPSIQAVEYNSDPMVYGWFHNLNDGDVGEYVPGKAQVSLVEILKKAYSISSQNYLEMCTLSFESASYFSIDKVTLLFIEVLKNSDSKYTFVFSKWKRILLKISRQFFKPILLTSRETIYHIN